MTQEQWMKIFILNDRVAHLYTALSSDLFEYEKVSGLSMNEAQSVLEEFAVIMTKTTDALNEKLIGDRAELLRKGDVEDVLRKVRNKIRLERKVNDNIGEDRSGTFE